MSVPQVGQNAPLGLHVVAPLASTDIIHESTVGDAEPESSRMVLALLGVGLLGLFALFSNVFGWDSVPVLGDLVPFCLLYTSPSPRDVP